MFSKICLIFVALIMSTNAGGPSINTECTATSFDLLKFVTAMKIQIDDYEGQIAQAIIEYETNNLLQTGDEFKLNVLKIVDDKFNEIKSLTTDNIEKIVAESQGEYQISCFDEVMSALDNLYNSAIAFANTIISQHL